MGNLLCFPHIVELRMLVSVYKKKIWGPVAPQESAENMLPGDSGHKSDRFYSQEALKGWILYFYYYKSLSFISKNWIKWGYLEFKLQ